MENIQQLTERTAGKNPLALAARMGERDIGYALGYWLSPIHFYYWLGGVLPDSRHQGAGQRLLRELERRVVAIGGEEISVKSMNRYPAMLMLLIRNGYLITAVTPSASGHEKIHFIKRLL